MAIEIRIVTGDVNIPLTNTTAPADPTHRWGAYTLAGARLHTTTEYSGRGGELVAYSHPNVSETFTAVLHETTRADNATLMRQLAHILTVLAPLAQRKPSVPRVYVEIRLDYDTDTWYRSEVLHGAVVPSTELFGNEWIANSFELAITWERRPYWELSKINDQDALYAVAGTWYGQGLPSTEWAVLGNGRMPPEYVSRTLFAINNDQIPGDLPTPLILHIINGNPDHSLRGLWFGHNLFNFQNEGLMDFVYEAEWATTQNGDPATLVSDPPYSNGTALEWTLSGGQSGDIALAVWDFNDPAFPAFDFKFYGSRFRVLARGVFPAANQYRVQIVDGRGQSYGPVEWQGIAVQAYLLDLGVVTLPPANAVPYDGSNSPPTQDIVMEFAVKSLAAQNVTLDFIYLLPTDGYRYLEALDSTGFTYDDWRLVDDQNSGHTYLEPGRLRAFAGEGQLSLYPMTRQSLNFVAYTTTGQSPNLTINIKVFCRPRRSML